MFLSFVFLVIFQKNAFFGILGPPSYGIGATIRIGQEMLCLPYAGFFLKASLSIPTKKEFPSLLNIFYLQNV